MFALVHFMKTDDVAVVPVHWISGKYCFWPNSKDVRKLAKAMHSPKSDWQKHEVTIKSIYASYDEARHYEARYQETSNLDTEEENLGKGKRGIKRKKPFCHCNDSSCDEESVSLLDLPPMPVPMAVEEMNSPVRAPMPVQEMIPFPITIKEERQESPSAHYIVLDANNETLSQPNCSGESSSLPSHQSAVMKEILHIKLQMKQQSKMMSAVVASLNTLIERTRQQKPARTSNVLPVKLPLETMEELSNLEQELLQDNDTKELLYEVLIQIGGISLGNLIRRMLAKIMTNELAMKFSWLGAKEKDAFNNLKVSKLIFSATRRNPLYQHVTDQEIENVIKDWLRHAKARNSKSKESERENI